MTITIGSQDLVATLIAVHKITTTLGVPGATYVRGKPGIGKSSLDRQAADIMGIGHCKVNIPTTPMEDFGGIPVISSDKRTMTYAMQDEALPWEGSSHFPPQGILTLDEAGQALIPEQKLCASLVQDRALHGRRLMPGWSIVANGNNLSDRSGAVKLLGMFADRMTIYDLEIPHEDWIKWAQRPGSTVDELLVAYHSFTKGAYLNAYDAAVDISPTARSWVEHVSPYIGRVPNEFATFAGAVGEGAAADFLTFVKTFRELPNIDAIILDPLNADVPEKLDVLWAVASSLAKASTEHNFERITTYANRMPAEFTTLVVLGSMRKDISICNTRAFRDWSVSAAGAAALL